MNYVRELRSITAFFKFRDFSGLNMRVLNNLCQEVYKNQMSWAITLVLKCDQINDVSNFELWCLKFIF